MPSKSDPITERRICIIANNQPERCLWAMENGTVIDFVKWGSNPYQIHPYHLIIIAQRPKRFEDVKLGTLKYWIHDNMKITLDPYGDIIDLAIQVHTVGRGCLRSVS